MAIIQYEVKNRIYFKVKVKVRDCSGNQITRSSQFAESGKRISSLNKAKEIEFKLKQELENQKNGKTGWTWETWHQEALREIKKQWSAKTLENYDGVLQKWMKKIPDKSSKKTDECIWKDKELESITDEDVYDLIHTHLPKKGAKPTVKANVHRRIHRLFEMAIERGIIGKNPARSVKVRTPRKDPTVLRESEVETLLKMGQKLGHPFYPHWVLALMTGCRNGELYSLTWKDVDLERNIITINKQFTSKDGLHEPKWGSSRVVDINSQLHSFLLGLRAQGTHSEKMWEWVDDRRIDKREVHVSGLVLPRIRAWRRGYQAEELRRFCKQIKITSLSFHNLRSTYITNLLDNGLANNKVMALVGHKRLQTTDRYNSLTGTKIRGAAEIIGYEIPSESDEGKVINFPGKS